MGRPPLYTRWEMRRITAAVVAGLLGLGVAAWVAAGVVAWLSGHEFVFPSIRVRPLISGASGGGLLGLPHGGSGPVSGTRAQFPITVTWPAAPVWTVLVAAPLWTVWWWFTGRPLIAASRRPAREAGFASSSQIRDRLGARRARRAGRYTLPEMPWWRRSVLATEAFGFPLGTPSTPRSRTRLWADWEQRIRIVAASGWGKTARLLVPIIRALPGPALIASIEPQIFEWTVQARQWRRTRLRWWWLDLTGRRWLPRREYPIAVVDFSAPEARMASGYPSVRWNPIDGSESYPVAARRAAGQVSRIEIGDGRSAGGDQNDAFFRTSASAVFAAWLHAAALGGRELEDLEHWLADITDPLPLTILTDDRRADYAAVTSLRKHLSPAAAKTRDGVERYLTLAMESWLTNEGRALAGRRFSRTGQAASFDMNAFVAAGGTLYLLAEPTLIARVRPMLSMLADEMFLAARAVALTHRGRRLPLPFVGVVDETRDGVPVTVLPTMANTGRKHGITFVYAVQAQSQEDAVYGADADALRASAGVSIYGGIDPGAAREVSERAGPVPVVTSVHGHDGMGSSDQIQWQDTLTVADQQEMADGVAVALVRGLRAFRVYLPSAVYGRRRSRRRIGREAQQVASQVAAARSAELAGQESAANAAAAGAVFEHRPRT